MFLHFGDCNIGLFGSRRNLPILSQYIIDSPGPVVISISQKENNLGIVFSPEAVADAMDIIYMSRKPVFVKVACSPSITRTGVTGAVVDALTQINTIYNLFVGYQMTDLLAGYCLNNIIFGELFNDGSRWDINSVNTIVDDIHARNKSVMIITDPGIASTSKYLQPQPYTANFTDSFVSPVSRIGYVTNIIDYIIHLNVLYPWHLWSSSYPELVFDLSRFSSVISTMRTYQKSNVKHFCHQGHVQSPTPEYFQASFDQMMGVMTSSHHQNRILRAATFIEACGVVDYTLTHDSAYGAISNIALHPLMYRGSNRTPFFNNVSMHSRNGNIFVTNNTTSVTRVFDSALKELVMESV